MRLTWECFAVQEKQKEQLLELTTQAAVFIAALFAIGLEAWQAHNTPKRQQEQVCQKIICRMILHSMKPIQQVFVFLHSRQKRFCGFLLNSIHMH